MSEKNELEAAIDAIFVSDNNSIFNTSLSVIDSEFENSPIWRLTLCRILSAIRTERGCKGFKALKRTWNHLFRNLVAMKLRKLRKILKWVESDNFECCKSEENEYPFRWPCFSLVHSAIGICRFLMGIEVSENLERTETFRFSRKRGCRFMAIKREKKWTEAGMDGLSACESENIANSWSLRSLHVRRNWFLGTKFTYVLKVGQLIVERWLRYSWLTKLSK